MMFKHYKNDKEFKLDKIREEITQREIIKKISNEIKGILQQPFEDKTEKQQWRRKGMEEGLKMVLEICDEIMEKRNGTNN